MHYIFQHSEESYVKAMEENVKMSDVTLSFVNVNNSAKEACIRYLCRKNRKKYFKEIVSSEEKYYENVICFGDFHSPSQSWGGSRQISREDGKKLCKFKVKNLISFHTTDNSAIAGYAEWFSPENTIHVKDWVKYF